MRGLERESVFVERDDSAEGCDFTGGCRGGKHRDRVRALSSAHDRVASVGLRDEASGHLVAQPLPPRTRRQDPIVARRSSILPRSPRAGRSV